MSSYPWLPTQLTSEDTEVIDQILATPQPHLVALAKEVAHIEHLHDMQHLHPFVTVDPALCARVSRTIDMLEHYIDRGLRATYN